MKTRKYIFDRIQDCVLLARNISFHQKDNICDLSIELEKEVWIALELISMREEKSISEIFESVDKHRLSDISLNAAIKVFVISYLLFESAQSDEGKSIVMGIMRDQSVYKIVSSKRAS